MANPSETVHSGGEHVMDAAGGGELCVEDRRPSTTMIMRRSHGSQFAMLFVVSNHRHVPEAID